VVVVRRPNYKMKIEVPWGNGETPLVVSINLTRVSHGRGTLITISRSREDQFRGPTRDIEVAGSVLRKRLASHVEFIEDSFASLYFDDSMIDLHDTRVEIDD